MSLTEALAKFQQSHCIVDLGMNVIRYNVVEVYESCTSRLTEVQ